MYERYWQLEDKPFRNTPDPHYLFFSKRHEEALTRMLYCITEGQGAMMLTGEYGCGKTMLSRVLLDELDPERYEVAYIPYSSLTATEFLVEILRQFGCDVTGRSKVQLLHALSDCLRAFHAAGRHTIILVDEAHLILDTMTLEEIRLLLNFQQDRKFYLTMLLVGQPQLRDRVADMPQLLQRLHVQYHLRALEPEDALRYLRHRIAVAGGRSDIFTRDAERAILQEGGGIPRRINSIADMALLCGFGKKMPVVDEELIHAVARDLKTKAGTKNRVASSASAPASAEVSATPDDGSTARRIERRGSPATPTHTSAGSTTNAATGA